MLSFPPPLSFLSPSLTCVPSCSSLSHALPFSCMCHPFTHPISPCLSLCFLSHCSTVSVFHWLPCPLAPAQYAESGKHIETDRQIDRYRIMAHSAANFFFNHRLIISLDKYSFERIPVSCQKLRKNGGLWCAIKEKDNPVKIKLSVIICLQ